MNFYVMTLFPELIDSVVTTSILGRAVNKGLINVKTINIRDYTNNKHNRVDDYTYGGGAGMLMQAQPIYDCHRAILEMIGDNGGEKVRTIYLTPQAKVFEQSDAKRFANEENIILLCGHYEGIDERVLEEIVTDYVSIGDYVLTGGELPALVCIDAISRMVPGVLGNEVSGETESFDNGLLEYPQYSRPEIWMDKKVPDVLMSGHHANIEKWRLEQSLIRTQERRPDLYEKYIASKESM